MEILQSFLRMIVYPLFEGEETSAKAFPQGKTKYDEIMNQASKEV